MSGELTTGIGFLIVVVTFVGGIYWRWSSMVGGVDKDLQAYKLHVSEHYATKQGVTEQMVALTKAVNDVGDRLDKRLDGMTDRLDRVIEASHKPVRRQS
jgi:hypothetical protein